MPAYDLRGKCVFCPVPQPLAVRGHAPVTFSLKPADAVASPSGPGENNIEAADHRRFPPNP
jgi:hypothetical protein